MTRHAAVGINDNFTTSQTAVTHWATDNETTGRVDEEFGGRSQPFSGQNWLDDLFHYRFLQRFPQGTQIAFLMRDDNGIVQLWLISPQGGEPRQLTHNKTDIQSAFNWHPSGEWLGFVLDNRIACAHAQSGEVEYLTENHANPPSADAVVFSPDGQWLAWMEGGQLWITETDR